MVMEYYLICSTMWFVLSLIHPYVFLSVFFLSSFFCFCRVMCQICLLTPHVSIVHLLYFYSSFLYFYEPFHLFTSVFLCLLHFLFSLFADSIHTLKVHLFIQHLPSTLHFGTKCTFPIVLPTSLCSFLFLLSFRQALCSRDNLQLEYTDCLQDKNRLRKRIAELQASLEQQQRELERECEKSREQLQQQSACLHCVSLNRPYWNTAPSPHRQQTLNASLCTFHSPTCPSAARTSATAPAAPLTWI